MWIKYLSRLVSGQLSKHKCKHHICDRCLHYFVTKEKLSTHEMDCSEINDCAITLPSPGNDKLNVKNCKYMEKVPFVVYADFECILKKSESTSGNTQITQIHEPCSVGYYVKYSFDDNLSRYTSYRGTDPAQRLSQELLTLAEQIEALHKNQKPMNLTPEEEDIFRDASHCHICQQSLDDRIRGRDHCHLTSRFRGAAHEECNVNYQDSRTIPIIFHNLSGYDSHLIIKQISTCVDGRIDLLPLTMERYESFTEDIVGSKVTSIYRFRPLHGVVSQETRYRQEDDYQTCICSSRRGTVKATYEKRCHSLRLLGLVG